MTGEIKAATRRAILASDRGPPHALHPAPSLTTPFPHSHVPAAETPAAAAPSIAENTDELGAEEYLQVVQADVKVEAKH